MKPNEWLELVTKHASAPDTVTDEELASLRSNYTVWKAALHMLRMETKNTLIHNTQKILKNQVLPNDDFLMIREGREKPDSVTDEQWTALMANRTILADWIHKIQTASSTLSFYEKFDQEFQETHGDVAPEVAEVYWKTRANNLEHAISEHRRGYVLANKQPNGLDFQLWQEIGQGEFHASRHIQMQKNGHISFNEG